MSWLAKIGKLVQDPPPEFVFELSELGLAWSRTVDPSPAVRDLPGDVLRVSPLKDNVLRADALSAAVQSVAPMNGDRKLRRAAIILPDYCARVGVLDFDTFPTKHEEQLALVRFRVKRSLALDVESVSLSWHVQPKSSGATKLDVVIAAISDEIVARYEAPFRAAGFIPGFVTLSALAALPLGGDPEPGTTLAAKLTGSILALSVLQGRTVKLFRCIELHDDSTAEISDILVPTLAYMEDQLGARPEAVRLCGFPVGAEVAEWWQKELGAPVTVVTSRFGVPGPANAGLLGYLETLEG